MGKLQHHLEHREGWSIGAKVEEVLFGLGFKATDMQRETSEFSGGWQMRIALAKLLLREPTILMLDEPTNHLDIESLTWLEEYLKGYDGSVVVISHDRRFLDNLTRRTIEIANGKAAEYKGNYSYYLKEREIRLEMLRSSYENQQEAIRATMAFVDRFRYQATKARQVQSRLKQLDKIERIEMDDEQGSISFDFPPPPSPGRILMKLEGVTKAYGPEPVFTDLDLTLERGDRIAFLGSNGAGKSTLARIIAGLEPIQAGTRTPGYNVIVSYYAQHQADDLDPKKTVLETLEDAAPAGLQQGLRRLLGCFLFTGDDVFKRVGRALRRREEPAGAGQDAPRARQPADPRRADQPPRRQIQGGPPGGAAALRRGLLHRLARPRLPRAAGDEGRRVPRRPRHDVPRRRHRLAREAAPRARGRSGRREEVGEGARRPGRRRRPSPPRHKPGQRRLPGRDPSRGPGRRERPHRPRRPTRSANARTRSGGSSARSACARCRRLSRSSRRRSPTQEERKKEIETRLGDPAVCQSPERVSALSVEYRELTTNLAYSYDEWAKLEGEIEKADRETAG